MVTWEQGTDAYRWEPNAEPGAQGDGDWPDIATAALDAVLTAMEEAVFPLMELHRLDQETT